MSNEMRDALGVIINDPKIHDWLAENDPMALRQAKGAWLRDTARRELPLTPTCILTGEDGENPDDCETHDHEEQSLTVTVANTFDAISPHDAVEQMVTWLQDNAHAVGCRVEDDNGNSVFVDAEDL